MARHLQYEQNVEHQQRYTDVEDQAEQRGLPQGQGRKAASDQPLAELQSVVRADQTLEGLRVMEVEGDDEAVLLALEPQLQVLDK